MVNALVVHLRQLAEQPTSRQSQQDAGAETEEELGQLLGQLVRRVHHEQVWARILLAGAQAPASLGVRLLPLVDTSAVLAHPFTRYAAGQLIRAVEPLLTGAEHAAIEERILGLRSFFDMRSAEQAGFADHARDQLLGCLDPNYVRLTTVQTRLVELATLGGPPELQEPWRVQSYWRRLDLADRLADEGIPESDVPPPLREALGSLYDNVQSSRSNGDAQLQQTARGRLLDDLQAVLAAIDGALPGGPLGTVVEELMLDAAEMAAADPGATPDSPAGKLVLRLLLQAASTVPNNDGGS
jgi:hypothetical protein